MLDNDHFTTMPHELEEPFRPSSVAHCKYRYPFPFEDSGYEVLPTGIMRSLDSLLEKVRIRLGIEYRLYILTGHFPHGTDREETPLNSLQNNDPQIAHLQLSTYVGHPMWRIIREDRKSRRGRYRPLQMTRRTQRRQLGRTHHKWKDRKSVV